MEKINFQDLPSTSTPLNSTNLNQMQDNMEDAIVPIKLVNIGVETPSTATTGDMFYNTTDNKVYTAIGENTWDSGSTPRYDGFYINTSDNTLFYYNGSTLIGVGGSSSGIGGDTLPVGMIMPGAMTGSVDGWLICRGQAVSRTEYSELFNAIGTTYGSGDGSTTFNIPNIAGKMIIGLDPDDTDFSTIGGIGGSKTHTQTVSEMPSHNHTGTSHGTNYGSNFISMTNGGDSNMVTTNSTGEGEPMDIMNPHIVMNYYIKAHQTAPVTATVKNDETTSETDVYSCNYINNIVQNNTNYTQIGDLKICWGTVQASYVNPNVMSTSIYFPITYNNIPNVQLTLNGTNNVSEELDENAKVTNITSEDASVYVHSKNGGFNSDWKQNVNWLAIGY